MRGFLLSAAVVGLITATSPAHADLVTNGGFETGDFTGWSVVAGATQVVGSGYDGFTPHSGSYFAALGDTSSSYPFGTLSQTISDTAGTTLSLTYWLASDGALPNYIDATWNGTTLPASVVVDSGAFGWTEYQINVAATGSDTLLFHEQNVPAYDALDDVSLTIASGVPEPASLALLAAGLAGVGFVRRRRA